MIKTYVGPMFSGKTSVALSVYRKIWNKGHIRCFKPRIDTRDFGLIKSRDFEEGIEARCIDYLEEIMDYIDDSVKTIFIDEAQFLRGSYQVLSYLSIVRDIDIHISGLNMDGNQKPFGLMPQILAISDEIINIPAVCYDCNKDASYTFTLDDLSKDNIKVGDSGYIPLCRSCLLKRLGKDNLAKRLIYKPRESSES